MVVPVPGVTECAPLSVRGSAASAAQLMVIVEEKMCSGGVERGCCPAACCGHDSSGRGRNGNIKVDSIPNTQAAELAMPPSARLGPDGVEGEATSAAE